MSVAAPPPGQAPLLYLITDRHATAGRPLAEVVGAALRAFAGMGKPAWTLAVQLREKDLEARPLLALAHELRAATAAVGVRLFVNDRIDVALAAGADGVHLGGGSLRLDDVHRIAPRLQVAASTHAVGEVAAFAADGRASFVVFGPVFDTPSKRALGAGGPLGLDQLRAASTVGVPVLALGGVGAAEAAGCRAAGAAGIACIRAILANRDPASALRSIFEAIERT